MVMLWTRPRGAPGVTGAVWDGGVVAVTTYPTDRVNAGLRAWAGDGIVGGRGAFEVGQMFSMGGGLDRGSEATACWQNRSRPRNWGRTTSSMAPDSQRRPRRMVE